MNVQKPQKVEHPESPPQVIVWTLPPSQPSCTDDDLYVWLVAVGVDPTDINRPQDRLGLEQRIFAKMGSGMGMRRTTLAKRHCLNSGPPVAQWIGKKPFYQVLRSVRWRLFECATQQPRRTAA